MEQKKQFRKLYPNEIDVRIGTVNKDGVSLLLYKDARVDQNLLDETFGVYGWQRKHEMIGDELCCTISIKDPDSGEWIEKQDVGVESYTEKVKGRFSDSFKRAAFNIGIGRELYTAPDMFVSKSDLSQYKDDDDKPKCYNTFKVLDIQYEGDSISSVTIALCEYGNQYAQKTFTNDLRKNPASANNSKVLTMPKETAKTSTKSSEN